MGIAIGSLLINRLLKGEVSTKYVVWSMLGMTFFTLDLYLQSLSVWQIMPERAVRLSSFLSYFTGIHISLDLFFLAIFGGVYIAPLYAFIQKNSDPEWCSRMISANNIMNSIFMVFSAVWVALLANFRFSIPEVFLSIALMNLFFAVYLLRLTPDAKIRSWMKISLRFLLKGLYRVEVKGMENYYAAGDQFLIITNYTSFLDIILLAVFLPDTLGIVVNTTLTSKFWFKLFVSLARIFSIKPWEPMAIRNIIHAAKKSKKFILAPESYIDKNNTLKQIYEASGLIVKKTGFPVLPIQITGALFLPFSNMKGKAPKRWFPKIIIHIKSAYLLKNNQLGQQLFQQTTQILFDSFPWKNTLFDALLEMRKIHGNRKIANDIQEKALTYTDIVTHSFILGNVIARNTTQGEYVGVLLPTTNVSIICFFALQAFGRVPAMLNFSLGSQRLKATCTLANINIVYTSYVFIAQAKLAYLVEALQEINIKVVYLENLHKEILLLDKVKGFMWSFFSPLWNFHVPVKSDMPAVVLFTSGSEGSPKGVVLNHQNVLANTYQIATFIHFTTDDILFSALPIFHCFGLTTGMLLPLLHGFSVFFYPLPLHYRAIPEWVKKTKATIMLATDTFLNGYANYATSEDFRSVHSIFAGAEKIKEETLQKWNLFFGVSIFEGYGVTEAAPVIAVNNPIQYKIGAVGYLLPGMHYRLMPVDGISRGGRLWVSGPNIMIGYLEADNPGHIVPLKEGWHDTGDIAFVNDEGFLILLGRAKRFAKIGGEMVSFSVVESAITHLWPTHLHAILSVPDSKKGERLVLLTNCPEAQREILTHHMRQQGYSELFTPKQIQILSEMPVLGSGKIDYVELEKFV